MPRQTGQDQASLELARLLCLLCLLCRREARCRGAQELTCRELVAGTGWSLGIVARSCRDFIAWQFSTAS